MIGQNWSRGPCPTPPDVTCQNHVEYSETGRNYKWLLLVTENLLKKSRQSPKYARAYLRKGRYVPAGLSMKYYLFLLCLVFAQHSSRLHDCVKFLQPPCQKRHKNGWKLQKHSRKTIAYHNMSAVDKTAGSNEPLWPYP